MKDNIKDFTNIFNEKRKQANLERAMNDFDKMNIDDFENKYNVKSAGEGVVIDPENKKDLQSLLDLGLENDDQDIEEDDNEFEQLTDDDFLK